MALSGKQIVLENSSKQTKISIIAASTAGSVQTPFKTKNPRQETATSRAILCHQREKVMKKD
jgi:hypothetical protein